MKTLIILLFFLCGCVAEQVHNDRMYITRQYVGNFVSVTQEKKVTVINTTETNFKILGNAQLKIIEDARCYVKYIPERIAGSNSMAWVLYFTWDGTENLYRIKQNYFTGQIL